MGDPQEHIDPVEGWVIYEDESILAVNKPSGLRTIIDGYEPSLPYLSGLLNARYGRLWTVHRLDKDTSGIILFARDSESHRKLNQQFEQRKIVKAYHAVVSGTLPWKDKRIDLPLLVNGDRKHRTIVDHHRGKPAASRVEVLAQYSLAGMVSVHPEAGYTHQIRAHLAAVGSPILFDHLYRRSSDPPFPELHVPTRLALHASSIEFVHPGSGNMVRFYANYQEDFNAILAALIR